jgi:hypothetical protein
VERIHEDATLGSLRESNLNGVAPAFAATDQTPNFTPPIGLSAAALWHQPSCCSRARLLARDFLVSSSAFLASLRSISFADRHPGKSEESRAARRSTIFLITCAVTRRLRAVEHSVSDYGGDRQVPRTQRCIEEDRGDESSQACDDPPSRLHPSTSMISVAPAKLGHDKVRLKWIKVLWLKSL